MTDKKMMMKMVTETKTNTVNKSRNGLDQTIYWECVLVWERVKTDE